MMNRREWLKMLSMASAAFAAGCCSFGAGERKLRLGCQMWSVDDLWKKDLPGSLAKMRAMGYEGVQSMAFWKWNRDELAKLLDDNGLAIVDMPIHLEHVNAQNLNSSIEFCQRFGVDFLFLPYLQNGKRVDTDWKGYVDDIVAAAERLRPHGIRLGFHNHQHEFKRKINGISMMEELFSRPELDFELDVGHAKLAGEDPVALLARLGGRVPSIHAKPGGGLSVGGEGDANDWPAILAACRRAGTNWAVVECETRRNTFEDIDASSRYLKPMI